jgi:hypothetical protein
MGLIPLGILSSAGSQLSGTYELIESQILGTAATSVTFSGLATYANTYEHLQIRMSVRSNRSGFTSDTVYLRFNADTASNYSLHLLDANGSSVRSAAAANQTGAYIQESMPAALATANVFYPAITDILDPFSTSKYKTIRTLSGGQGGASVISLSSGNWRSTSAVTSVTLYSTTSSNLSVGSRFSLYGIR